MRLGATEWVSAELVDEVLASAVSGMRGPGRFRPGSWSMMRWLWPCSSRILIDDVRRTWWGRWRGWTRRSRQVLVHPGPAAAGCRGDRGGVPRRPGRWPRPGWRGLWWGMRVAAVDGFLLDVPDTPANRAAFGGPVSRGQPRVSQARVVTLTETGTHGDAGGRVLRGEQELAVRWRQRGGMLVMSTGLGWRCGRSIRRPGASADRARSSVAAAGAGLEDGTYLARMNLAGEGRASRRGVVRVIGSG